MIVPEHLEQARPGHVDRESALLGVDAICRRLTPSGRGQKEPERQRSGSEEGTERRSWQWMASLSPDITAQGRIDL
jgi:hypothetical protein